MKAGCLLTAAVQAADDVCGPVATLGQVEQHPGCPVRAAADRIVVNFRALPGRRGRRQPRHRRRLLYADWNRAALTPGPPQTEAAVTAAMAGGDTRVSFVDTTGRLGSVDLTDSVHPDDRGHRVIADRLAPVIAARIGS